MATTDPAMPEDPYASWYYGGGAPGDSGPPGGPIDQQPVQPMPPDIEMPAMDARTGEDVQAPQDPYADAMAPQQPATPPGEPDASELEAGPEPWRTPHMPAEYANPQDLASGKVAPKDRQTALTAMSPDERARAVTSMTPEEFINYQGDRNKSLVAQQAAAQAKADTENFQRQQQNMQMQRDSVAKADADTKQVMADAQRLANVKEVRPKAGAMDIFGMMLGGFASQGSGGRNLAAEQFDKGVEQDIAAQREGIQNQWKGIDARKSAIAQEYERHGDLYKAQETYRVAAYQQAINKMQTDLQQYDPQGATAIWKRQQIDDLHTKQADYLQKFHDTSVEQQLKIQKVQIDAANADRERAALQETQRHNRQSESIDWTKTAIDREKIKADTKGEKDARELAGRAIGGIPQGVVDGKVVRGPLAQPDGSVFIPNAEDDAKKLKKMTQPVNTVNRLTNQMARDIADLGMLDKSSTLATAKHQRLMADRESLIFALHGAEGIEGFRPGTADMLKELLGGVDPDKWGRDATAGILRARDNINDMYTGELHQAGWLGDRYSPADTSHLDEPVSTTNEKTVERLTIGTDENNKGHNGRVVILDSDRKDMDAFAETAINGKTDAEKEQASNALLLATKSKIGPIREYARSKLDQIAAAVPVTGSAPVEPDDKSVAHETPPPVPAKKEKLYPQPKGTLR